MQNNESVENKDPISKKQNYILTEPIKRILNIDSQFRDNLVYPFATNFTFHLSEPLIDVISLKLYSLQIPFTWYTIGSEFGSNFFYLKGISPGINNRNFDYKIQIESGNYQQQDFAKYINDSFQKITNMSTDVSFGTTGVSFNNINSKLTTTIDIKSVFNETNYFIDFSNGVGAKSNDQNNVSSIAQLFGYHDDTYYPYSVYSKDVGYESQYKITKDNRTIKIILYQSSIDNYGRVKEYNDVSDVSYNIVSSLPIDNSYNSTIILQDFNNQIQNSIFIDKTKSSLTLVNQKYELKLVLDRKYFSVPNGEYIKSYVIFSGDLFLGQNSLFNFDNSCNELSNIISEKKSLETKTSYFINSSPSITFTCTNINYNNGPTFKIPNSNDTYNAHSYIDFLNSYLIDPGNNFSAKLSLDLINNYITVNYHAKPIIDISNISFDISMSNVTHIKNNVNNIKINIMESGYFINENENITITLKNDNIRASSGIILKIPIPSRTFSFKNDLISHIITTIRLYKDTDKSKLVDLSQSTFSIIDISGGILICNLTIVAMVILNEKDYTMELNYTGDYNLWKEDFGLDSSYNLSPNPNNQFQSKIKFYTNLLQLTEENNYFLLRPVKNINGGVYTIDEIYKKTITLDLSLNMFYTKEEIAKNINKLFNNDLTKGSYVDLSGNYTIIRLNINKIFTSLDYKLVFYDGDFTKCNYGNRHSIGNVKWDTTLGWILGYRNLTEYNLTIDNLSNDGIYNSYFNQPFTIDTSTLRSIIKLTGDTAINVNLYNYLLIVIDDFCQNRINDGLVTIIKTENNIPLPSYANRTIYRCDPSRTGNVFTINRVDNNNLTSKQIYSASQILNIKELNSKNNNLYSAGPNSQDIFGMVPIKTGGLSPGDSFIDFSGGLQNQDRKYVGPINLRRMSIQLLNDKGCVLDLNGANWSMSLIVEQIYNPAK